jgi:proline iminopeptidase
MRVNVGDVALYVRAEGAGRPLVLLHGGPGLDGSVFFPALSPLADEGVRLLAVDHRANGRSDASDPARWTVPQMADDVESLIAELGLERPIVMGHSFGTFVAQQHMAEHGTAAGYVLMGTVDAAEELARIGERLAAFEPEYLREQVTRSWDEEATVETVAEAEQLWRDQLPFHAGPRRQLVRAMQKAGGSRSAGGAAPLRHRRRVRPRGQPDRLRRCRQPVLVLSGGLDRTTPAAAAHRLAQLLRTRTSRDPGAALVLDEQPRPR